MRKIVLVACVLCVFPAVADAWFWNSGKSDESAVENDSIKSVSDPYVRKKKVKLPAEQDADSEASNVKKEKTDREKLIEGAYGTKGSANLLRLQSDSSNRGKENFDVMMKNREKITNDTVEGMKARSEKYKEQYEAQRGIPLDEMEAYYSKNIGVEKDKKLDQVYDPLDKY